MVEFEVERLPKFIKALTGEIVRITVPVRVEKKRRGKKKRVVPEPPENFTLEERRVYMSEGEQMLRLDRRENDNSSSD